MSAKTSPARNKHCNNGSDGNGNSGASCSGVSGGGGGIGSGDRKLDITHDELDRIREAFKKEEFRKLFCDYVEEIQDPENRKIYEDEIKQFERERGVNVKFINPEPGFVVKTSVDGQRKCFINIAKCPEIAKPTSAASCNPETGERGLNWSIPLAQGSPHDDLDNQKKRCTVYDVVFHPDALHLGTRDARFRKLLIDTALDAVEREFKVKLDRANLKFPKLDFKGIARPTVIRTLAKNATKEETEPHPLDHIFPAKPDADAGEPKVLPLNVENQQQQQQEEFATPRYRMKHRRGVDLAEYTDEVDARLNLTLPTELLVEIELPLLRTTAECQLDVTERTIYFLSERPGAKYRLNINLPYEVDDRNGNAKFDIEERILRVKLAVVQPDAQRQRDMHEILLSSGREDSGVECSGSGSGDESNSPSPTPPEMICDNCLAGILDAVDAAEDDTDSSSPPPSPVFVPVSVPLPFLKPTIHYQFPGKFDCNVLDNVLSLVLHVRNVQNDSIATSKNDNSLHLRFTSIGSGYYPSHYAFLFQLPSEAADLDIIGYDVEAWENNVVLNITVNTPGELIRNYLAGLDKNDLKTYSIQGQFNFKSSSPRDIRGGIPKKATTPPPPPSLASSLDVSVERSECERSVEIEIKPHLEHGTSSAGAANTTEDEDHATNAGGDRRGEHGKKANKKQRKKNKKRRSYSESTCDDIKAMEQHTDAQEAQEAQKSAKAAAAANAGGDKANNTTGVTLAMEVPQTQQQRKHRSFSECRGDSFSATNTPTFKSILKRFSRYEARPSISDSCSSSIDDCSSFYSSMDGGAASSLHFSQSFCGIPEENSLNSQSMSESCKKTVRFSENIKKRIFRLDSSIIGQRKKNQKRRDRKQRALERRLSEGDSADYEDNNNHHQQANDKTLDKEQFFKTPRKANNKQKENNNKNNKKSDSGHDSTNGIKNNGDHHNAGGVQRCNSSESESSQEIDNNKNTMIFDMDM